ncbi:MAG: tRNA (cytidine(34)-2'-O)-methyltransferase [Spirochaetia bacterium]|nr:tRNA (cytidine(34)-2'-O)-methyltransferase [Spirochaetia bacterium]
MPLNIVLLEPEIPQNTGNIARTCAAVQADLHLIKPLGFSIEDKYLKRAGLDYWNLLNITVYEDIDDFFAANPAAVNSESGALTLFTTKAEKLYTEYTYPETSYLMFGKESRGIPEEILIRYPQSAVRIPMISTARSLNLSNAAAVAAYEYLRQHQFRGMEKRGTLHRMAWPSSCIPNS